MWEQQQLANLEAMGYMVKKLSPWHFRINKEECDEYIDFWPTTNRYALHKDGNFSPAAHYQDICVTAETYLH